MNEAETMAAFDEIGATLALWFAQIKKILLVKELAGAHDQTIVTLKSIETAQKTVRTLKAKLGGADAADVPEIRAANLRAIRNDPAIAEKISGAVRAELARLRKRVNSR